MSIRLIIPARRRSTRLPDKPLIKIAGVPMIGRTYWQCHKAFPKEMISVATDDDDIARVWAADGADVVMTSDSCSPERVGSPRRHGRGRPTTYVNVQGDEPLFNPNDIRALVSAAEANPDRVLMGYDEGLADVGALRVWNEAALRQHGGPAP